MISRTVILCVVAFIAGISPWIVINAVFVQLASLVQLSGYSIAAVLAVFVQVGTLAALLYTAWPLHQVPEWLIICLTFLLNLCAGVALSLSWDMQVIMVHQPRPVVVILATAAAGVSGALAVVQLYPITARGSGSCTASFSAGMGANGVVASLLGLVLAHPTWNYIAVSAIIVASMIAAVALVFMLPPPTQEAKTKDEAITTAALLQQDDPEIDPSDARWIGWPEAALQLALACLNYSLISLVPYALPTLLRAASIAAPAIGSISRLVVTFLPLPSRRQLALPSVALCLLWLGLFFAAVMPPIKPVYHHLTLAALFIFNINYAMQDTVLFLLAGRSKSEHREKAVRLVGAGQQTGAGIGSILGLLFAIFWPAS